MGILSLTYKQNNALLQCFWGEPGRNQFICFYRPQTCISCFLHQPASALLTIPQSVLQLNAYTHYIKCSQSESDSRRVRMKCLEVYVQVYDTHPLSLVLLFNRLNQQPQPCVNKCESKGRGRPYYRAANCLLPSAAPSLRKHLAIVASYTHIKNWCRFERDTGGLKRRAKCHS